MWYGLFDSDTLIASITQNRCYAISEGVVAPHAAVAATASEGMTAVGIQDGSAAAACSGCPCTKRALCEEFATEA
jgi:hypothetical protein